jgi:hypothetical protein
MYNYAYHFLKGTDREKLMEGVMHSQPNCLCTIRQTSTGQMTLSFDTDIYTALEQ